jgi:hypothetical protein
MEHCCLDLIKYQTKIRPDLKETPFLDGHKLFVDSLSRVSQGKDIMDSVADGDKLEATESRRLANNGSAQTYEVFALNKP